MPDIVQRGLPVKQVQEDILEPQLIERCRGYLCVKISVEPRDLPEMSEGLTRCQFWATDPPAGTPVKRETTVVLVVGPNPCEEDAPAPEQPVPAPEPNEPVPAPEPEEPAPAPEPSPGGE